MRTKTLVVSLVTMMTCAVSSAFGADMFSGTWKVNIAKSTFDPGPPPKYANVQKIQSIANGITVVADGMNNKGQKTHNEWTAKFDGKDYPDHPTVDGKPQPDSVLMRSVKKVDDRTIEITFKRDGEVLSTVKHVVSKDGKTRTITVVMSAQGGATKNATVFEKQ